MCGIYAATTPSKFEVLDQVNRQRGNFASGLFYTDGNTYDIQRTEGSFDWDKIKLPDGFIYIGHNQAPTSKERKWKQHNCHPFERNNWIVAHNGVLTNFERLKKTYIPDHDNLVDTSIIPALLDMHEEHFDRCQTITNEVKNISHVLGLLEGTFGLWIVNIKTMNIYIARQGSTLFYDSDSFSSTRGEGYKEAEEGRIYRMTPKTIKLAGSFECKSPFFTI